MSRRAALSTALAAAMSLAAPALPTSVHAAEAPAASPRVATVTGAWEGGATGEGGIAYCAQRARYSTGHTLIIGRTREGAMNIALAIPGGALPVGERWPVSLRVDGALARERVATAATARTLVIGMGLDPDLFIQLKRGKTLFLKSAADDIGFTLTGTTKALAALERCAAGLKPSSPETAAPKAAPKAAGKSPTPGEAPTADAPPGDTPPGDAPAKPAPVFPETLAAVLGAAGLTEVQALVFPDLPPEKRPADFAWRIGKVLGGVRERMVPADVTLDALTTEYAEALRARCKGAGSARLSPIENHRSVTLRLGSVDCAPGNGTAGVHVSLVSYLSEAHLFATFFHETPPDNKAEADDIRDRLAAVFRRVATLPPEDESPTAKNPTGGSGASDVTPAEPKP